METDLLDGRDGGEELRLEAIDALRLVSTPVKGASQHLQHAMDLLLGEAMIQCQEVPEDLAEAALVRYGAMTVHGLAIPVSHAIGDTLLVVGATDPPRPEHKEDHHDHRDSEETDGDPKDQPIGRPEEPHDG